MLKELGKYKDNLSSILISDEYIPGLLLEDTSGLSTQKPRKIFVHISTWNRLHLNRPAIFFWKLTLQKQRPQQKQ